MRLARKKWLGLSTGPSVPIPKDPRLNDLYLVEFPKSGITWFCTMLANALCMTNEIPIRATYYNVQQLIPDVHMSNAVGEPFFRYPGYRFIKSHATCTAQYKHVVYLLRNPVSVLASYYRHSVGNGTFSGDIEEFVMHHRFGAEAYVAHVSSWLGSPLGSVRLHLIRYEDMRKDSVATLVRLFDNLGLCAVTRETISRAVEASSLEEMRRSEITYQENDPTYDRRFIREGREYPREGDIPPETERYVTEKASSILARFYPEMS